MNHTVTRDRTVSREVTPDMYPELSQMSSDASSTPTPPGMAEVIPFTVPLYSSVQRVKSVTIGGNQGILVQGNRAAGSHASQEPCLQLPASQDGLSSWCPFTQVTDISGSQGFEFADFNWDSVLNEFINLDGPENDPRWSSQPDAVKLAEQNQSTHIYEYQPQSEFLFGDGSGLTYPEDITSESDDAGSGNRSGNFSINGEDEPGSESSASAAPYHIADDHGVIGFDITCPPVNGKEWAFMRKDDGSKKLFIKKNSPCDVILSSNTRYPGATVRVTAFHDDQGTYGKQVKTCEKHKASGARYLTCLDETAKFDEKTDTVSFPFRPTGTEPNMAMTCHFKFHCDNSCFRNKKNIKIHFVVEDSKGRRLGKQSMDLRVCACPVRDSKTKSGESAKEKSSKKRKRSLDDEPEVAPRSALEEKAVLDCSHLRDGDDEELGVWRRSYRDKEGMLVYHLYARTEPSVRPFLEQVHVAGKNVEVSRLFLNGDATEANMASAGFVARALPPAVIQRKHTKEIQQWIDEVVKVPSVNASVFVNKGECKLDDVLKVNSKRLDHILTDIVPEVRRKFMEKIREGTRPPAPTRGDSTSSQKTPLFSQ